MTTLTKVGNSIHNTLSELKDKYCPEGHTCQDIATIGGLAFVIWFMYIAMLPIL
jgi:hypothetical protein